MGGVDSNSGAAIRRFCAICAAPDRLALCSECFRLVPNRIRERFIAAYERRIRDHAEYQEAVIEMYSWLRAYDGRNEGEKDVE